jgi:hypothetical protein
MDGEAILLVVQRQVSPASTAGATLLTVTVALPINGHHPLDRSV